MIKGIPSTMNDEWQFNLWKVIWHAAKIHGNREIISYRHLQGGKRHVLTYKMIYGRVCAIANALENLGVEPGDVIAILAWNDHRCYETFFSVPGVGAILLPLNFRLNQRDLIHILNHSRPRGLFFDETLIEIAGDLSEKYEFDFKVSMGDTELDEYPAFLDPLHEYEDMIKRYPKDYNWREIDERSTATACYTSGTTGLPKGVYYSHRSLIFHRLADLAFVNKMSPDDVYLQITPMYHINGHGIFIGATMVGSKLVFPGRYTPESLLDIIIREKVTVAPAIATLWRFILSELKKRDESHTMRIISETGGIEPPTSLLKELRNHGIELVHCWGATETDALATHSILKPEIRQLPEDEQLRYMAKQGYPIFSIEIKLVDPISGKEVEWDGESAGEIWVRGPSVIKEYYKDERSKESCTPDGWWKSGDLATIDEHGYLKIIDRIKDVIKSGGEWISSVDMENFLMTHPGVNEATVVGVPHPRWDERPVAIVVPEKKYTEPRELMEKKLKNYLLKRFEKWQIPEKIIFVDEIPKTGTGKYDKKLIREIYRDIYVKG